MENSEEVVGTIQEDPNTVRSTCVEGRPPPVVVHTNKTNIGQEDCGLGNNNHNENEGDEQEAEDIVDVTLPNATKDEGVFNE